MNTEVIDPTNGEYRQDIAEQPNTETPKKSGVQINVDESNAANEKVNAQNVPNSFDKTEAGQAYHQAKFGGQQATEGAGTVSTPKQLKRNQK